VSIQNAVISTEPNEKVGKPAGKYQKHKDGKGSNDGNPSESFGNQRVLSFQAGD
jgi:hypothetical protein